MIKTLKLKKRIIGIMLAACLASVIFAVPAYAAGGAYVSDTYVEVAEGSTAYVSVGVENATGSYSVSSSGCASANGSGWLDNEAVTIGIYGASVGSGTISVYFDTLATYDEDNLDGTSLSISVNVYEPDGGYTPDKGGEDGGQQPEEQETTTADPNADKLKVTIDGAEYTVLKDLADIELPKGFLETDGMYNGEKVRVLTFGDELKLYVLKKTDDGSIIFRTYNEKEKKFEALKTLVQNKITYYLLDFPAEEKAPEGYTAKDLKIGDYTVKGLVSDSKSYEDFYYLRALADGTAGYYAYDTRQGSIQRCMSLDETLNANELIKQMQKEAEEAALKAAKTEKLLKLLLLAAAVIIAGLIVALIIVAVKKNKNGGKGSGSGGSSQLKDFETDDFEAELQNVEDDLPNEIYETTILKPDDVPEGVSDLDSYEMDIENLIEDEAGTSWEDLGL